jgi:hypothetical protein
MHPSKSSTKTIQNAIKAGAWFVASLIAFDVAINVLFPYPSDPLNTSPGALNLYFDYGRSLEGKVIRQVGPTNDTSAPIARAGWLDNHLGDGEPTQPKPGSDLLIAVYGMSFSNDVGHTLTQLDPRITLRSIAGPAAPPNHSFAAYQLDHHKHQAKVVVLGILASSVKGLGAMSGMTWGAEVPAPFTFPQYSIENGKLNAVEPTIRSLDQLRAATHNPQEWNQFVNQLQQQDEFFDAFSFNQNWLDASAIARMIRRSWTQTHKTQITSQIHDRHGFNPNWEQIPVLKLMVTSFAETARQDGALPIVLLINDQGYEDHLYQLLHQTLDSNAIAYISTHTTAPATDKTNFLADGHFTDQANKRIAQQLLDQINNQLHRR